MGLGRLGGCIWLEDFRNASLLFADEVVHIALHWAASQHSVEQLRYKSAQRGLSSCPKFKLEELKYLNVFLTSEGEKEWEIFLVAKRMRSHASNCNAFTLQEMMDPQSRAAACQLKWFMNLIIVPLGHLPVEVWADPTWGRSGTCWLPALSGGCWKMLLGRNASGLPYVTCCHSNLSVNWGDGWMDGSNG